MGTIAPAHYFIDGICKEFLLYLVDYILYNHLTLIIICHKDCNF